MNSEKNFILSLMVFMQWFRKVCGKFKFKFDRAYGKWIDVDTIILTVTLSYNPTQNVYTLDFDNDESLNDFVSTQN